MKGSARDEEKQGREGHRIVPWHEVWTSARVPTAVATWFGAGFLPIAPGTWGSLAAIPCVHLMHFALGLPGVMGFALATSAIGVHAADVTSRLRGIGDPSEIVVDEVAGQAIALFPVYAFFPLAAGRPFWIAVAAAFLLFRVLDVWKPGPIGRLESLPGGLGIMADDLLGGACAALIVLGGLLLFIR